MKRTLLISFFIYALIFSIKGWTNTDTTTSRFAFWDWYWLERTDEGELVETGMTIRETFFDKLALEAMYKESAVKLKEMKDLQRKEDRQRNILLSILAVCASALVIYFVRKKNK